MKPLHGRALVLVFFATLVALVGFAVWFRDGHAPAASHRGPLAPLDADGRRLADKLKKHVTGVASEEHNVSHPEALERSARYIESTLSALGYGVSRQEFETEGVKVTTTACPEPAHLGRAHLHALGLELLPGDAIPSAESVDSM